MHRDREKVRMRHKWLGKYIDLEYNNNTMSVFVYSIRIVYQFNFGMAYNEPKRDKKNQIKTKIKTHST